MENRDLICIGCPLGSPLTVTIENGEVTEVKAQAPVAIGDVLLADVAGTGVDIVATKNVDAI